MSLDVVDRRVGSREKDRTSRSPFQPVPFEPEFRSGTLPLSTVLSKCPLVSIGHFARAKHEHVRHTRASMASEEGTGGRERRSGRASTIEDPEDATLGALAVRRMMRGEWLMRCRSDGTRTVRR